MADVLIVCVREDEPLAKAFADMFERAGLQVGGAPSAPEDMRACGAALVVWSQASIRSRAFLDAAQRAVNAGKAVVACLIAPPPAASINHAPAFDLTHWAGDPDDPSLDPLFFAVDRMVNSARAGVDQDGYDMAPAAVDPGYGQQDYPAPPYARARQAAPAPQRAAPVRAPAPPPRAPMPRQQAMDQAMDYGAPPPRGPAPRAPAPPPRRPAPPPAWRDSDPMAAEAQNWAAIRHSRNPEDFLKHLADFGAEGAFAELAQMRLAELEAETRRHRQTPAAAARQDAMRQEPVRLDPTRAPQRPPMRPAPHRQPQAAAPMAPRAPRPAPAMEGLEPTRPSAQPRMPRQASFEPVRSEPPPRPRPSEPPLMWRDEPRAPPPRPEPARASGGGAGRMIILFLVLGGAALGAGIFAGDRLSVASLFSGGGGTQQASVASDEWSDGPEAATPAAATARVDEASSRRLPAGELPARDTRQATVERGRGGPLEERRADPPVPRPQIAPERTTTSSTTSTTSSTSGGSPVDLDPSASTFGPVQLAAIPAPGGGVSPQTTASSAPPARPPQVLWSERPSAQRISELFPERAMRSNQVGRVELDCLIDTRGTPRCAVARETPPGFGFGAAAMRASGQFRAAPALDNGAPSTGAQTRLTIVFRSDGGR
ncbi:MAG: energy transducer TonB [Hyphomonadaceae bacterium]|nr:energy transducer TonB [Hyphomonadaceae bacterium]